MMSRSLYAKNLFLLLAVQAAACASVRSFRTDCASAHTVSDRSCVLDAVVNEIKGHAIFPGFDRRAWLRRARARRKKILAAKTPERFYVELQRLVATIRAPHLQIVPEQDPLFFTPKAAVRIVDGSAWILAAAPQTMLQPGDALIAVDETPTHERLAEFRSRISAATEEHRQIWAMTRALAGERGSETIWTVRGAGGNTRKIKLTRARAIVDRDPRPEAHHLAAGTLYVRIPTFGWSGAPRAFEKILRDNHTTKRLVLDIRDNGGGNSLIVDALLSYLLPAGTRLASYHHHRRFVKCSQTESADVSYSGSVVVLIGPRTCSAAEVFAGLLQRLGRGVLVGEPACGGRGIPNRRLLLPGRHVLKNVSGWIAWPDGSTDGFPVTPDIAVRPTPDTISAGAWSTVGDPEHDLPLATALTHLTSGE
jgi:C-terminal processing protease CtpA/Prc